MSSLSGAGERVNPRDFVAGDEEDLSKEQATLFRGIVARGNYLSIDRTDIRFAIKELARRMAKPRNVDFKQLIKFGRYLKVKRI